MTIKIDEIMNTLHHSAEHLKEDFELNNISPFGIESDSYFSFGYKIEYNNDIYLAQIKYKKVSQYECEEPSEFIWQLSNNNKITQHETIGSIMDEVLGLNE